MRDVSFGRVPKFFQAQAGQAKHNLEIDIETAFERVYNRIRLVPNFNKQKDRYILLG